jgi:protein SCO1/2
MQLDMALSLFAIRGRPMLSLSRSHATLGLALLLALSAAAAMLVAPGGVRRAHAAQEQSPPAEARHFTLTALDGRTVTDESYGGKWLVIYFGYTSCPDACPTTLGSIGTALDALGPLAEKVQPLFVTIDPARDKVKVMTAYLKAFDPRIIGLRGDPEQIEDAVKQFHVHYELHRVGNAYEIDHTGFVYVVGPKDAFSKLLLEGDHPGQQLADELRKLVK